MALKLNARQRLFVREFLRDKNATRSYIAAGYGKKGAAVGASKLLRNPKVADAIEKGLARLEGKLELSAERVLARVAEFAFQPLNAKELKNSAGINSLRATEMLAKHFKLLTDVTEMNANMSGAVQVVLTMPANGSEAPPAEPAESAKTGQTAKSDGRD